MSDQPAERAPREENGARPSYTDVVDEASKESFPASDPPSWQPLQAGPPSAHEGPEPGQRA